MIKTASTVGKMGHLWSFLTALTANWELHIWHPWDSMAGTACSFDVQNPDPSCPSKRGKGPAVKLRGWDVDLWCLSSAPRRTAFLQFASCPRRSVLGVNSTFPPAFILKDGSEKRALITSFLFGKEMWSTHFRSEGRLFTHQNRGRGCEFSAPSVTGILPP